MVRPARFCNRLILAAILVLGACSSDEWSVSDPEPTSTEVGTADYRERDGGGAFVITVATHTGGAAPCEPPTIADVQVRRAGTGERDGPITGIDVDVQWPERGCADDGARAFAIEFEAETLADFVFVSFDATPTMCADVLVNRPGANAGTEPAPAVLVDC
ncbi:MAG: hypothetical protein AAF467_12315 [Actinomycetota bacterium]